MNICIFRFFFVPLRGFCGMWEKKATLCRGVKCRVCV